MVRRSWPILCLILAVCGGPDRLDLRNRAPGGEIGAVAETLARLRARP
jgi:hypothetical protein